MIKQGQVINKTNQLLQSAWSTDAFRDVTRMEIKRWPYVLHSTNQVHKKGKEDPRKSLRINSSNQFIRSQLTRAAMEKSDLDWKNFNGNFIKELLNAAASVHNLEWICQSAERRTGRRGEYLFTLNDLSDWQPTLSSVQLVMTMPPAHTREHFWKRATLQYMTVTGSSAQPFQLLACSVKMRITWKQIVQYMSAT